MLPGMPIQICRWWQDDQGPWLTGCRRAFRFDEENDDPHDSGFKFCPYCGRNLVCPDFMSESSSDKGADRG